MYHKPTETNITPSNYIYSNQGYKSFLKWASFDTECSIVSNLDLGMNIIASQSHSAKTQEISNGYDYILFQTLVDNWHNERGFSSSVSEIIMCSSYQRIIAMGEKALPFIFRRLMIEIDDPDLWFYALKVIIGLDPVEESDRGDMKKMAKSWLNWAENNYGWQ